MSALPSGATFNEQMWVFYFALSQNDSNLNNISAQTWLDLYSKKDKSKFSKFLQENNIQWCVKNMPLDSRFNTADFKAAKAKFPSKKEGGLDWHNALKSQAISFKKHQKGKIASSKTFKVTRQKEFYALTNLTSFLKEVKSSFGAKFADDRWNPADVWFYTDEAVRQIKDMISHSSVMDSSYMKALPRSKQKAAAVYDIKQMNELLLVLYEKNILIPISLKKATGSGAVFTSRVGITNGRKDKDNQPKDPIITKKQYPITTDGSDYIVGGKQKNGGRNIKYDLKTQVATLDSNGKQVIKTEYDYLTRGQEHENNLIVASSGDFGAAGGGSMSLTEAENVIYTARGKSALNKSRRDAVPNNANILTDVYDNDIDRSKKYMDNMAKQLDPSSAKGELKLGNKKLNKSAELKYAKDAQNKLEIALAMKESGKEDEIIIDLWKSCTSKGIVRRKEFERILGRAAREEKYKAKKLGKTISMDESEKIAFDKLSTKISPSVKIPASVHLKLY